MHLARFQKNILNHTLSIWKIHSL